MGSMRQTETDEGKEGGREAGAKDAGRVKVV